MPLSQTRKPDERTRGPNESGEHRLDLARTRGAAGTERMRARKIFAEWFERTGDYRVAADRAGVSLRTAQRWRPRWTSLRHVAMALTGAKTNLETERTRFIGRERDLAAIAQLWRDGARLITLLGTGGIGKTRLAMRYADLHLYDYAADGGAWFCDVTDAEGVEGLCGAVARVLNAAGEGTTDAELVRRLGRAVANRGKLLFVLDNFDKLVEGASPAVSTWLGMAPNVHFLVTSRVALAIPGETTWHLDALGVPSDEGGPVEPCEAVELFVDRARLVRPGYTPTPAESLAIGRLTRDLDGIPLAIELAASRMDLLSPDELLLRVRTRLDLLADAGNAPPARRHQSMRATLDASWELLPEAERRAFAQASAFRGPFTIEAAEAVIRLGPERRSKLDVLRALRRRSLLQLQPFSLQHADGSSPSRPRAVTGHKDRAPSHLVLFETTRDYAHERLAMAGEAEAAARRHAMYFAHTAMEASHSLRHGTLPFFDLPNTLSACHWLVQQSPRSPELGVLALRVAVALAPWISSRAYRASSLLDTCIAAAPAAEPALVARARAARGDALRLLGEAARAMTDLEAACTLAREVDDPSTEAHAITAIAALKLTRGRLDDAKHDYETAANLAARSGDRLLEARILSNVAVLYRFWRRLAKAVETAQRARTIYKELGIARGEAETLTLLGTLYQGQSRLSDARACHKAALELMTGMTDRRLTGLVEANLGILEHETGALAAAQAHHERALCNFRELGLRGAEGCTLYNLAAVHAEAEELGRAETLFVEAIAVLGAAGDALCEAVARAQLGGVKARRGAVEEARAELTVAETSLDASSDPLIRESVTIQWGHLELALAARAELAGDAASAELNRNAVRARVAEVESRQASDAGASDEVRIAVRILKAALAQGSGASAAQRVWADARGSMLIARDGSAFCPAGGRAVSIAARVPLRRLLARLVDQHWRAPGEAVPAEELVECGWPAERVLPSAAFNRLRVAFAVLRRLGIGSRIVHRDRGYILDPDLPLQIVARINLP
jgi:predicted ATPase